MSDIERIPSMRKPSRQGVPKHKPRDMAKPMLESGKTREAPQIAPRSAVPTPATNDEPPRMPDEPMMPVDPTLSLELELASQPLLEPVSPPVPVVDPEPERVRVAEPEPEPVPEPEPPPEPEPEPEPVRLTADQPAVPADQPALGSSSGPGQPPAPPRLTLRQLVARADDSFGEFRAAALRYPKEHMDDRLGDDSWTRKQMLDHVAAWHDHTADRLIKMVLGGKSVPLDRDVDSFNAAAARIAIGKTVGEVLKDMESTYARLRRQVVRLTDAQLHNDDDWAVHIIAANTYEHYADHIAELTPPEPPPGSGARR